MNGTSAPRAFATAFIGAAALSAAGAKASGFAIREQSGSFQGLSFAGVAAGGADISTMYFNPATMALHDGRQAHLSLSYIYPKSEFKDGVAAGGAVSGSDGGNIAIDALVPATYAMVSAGNFRFGLGVTAPFGLETKQPDDWIGRYHATRSELLTVNVNPTIAYRVTDELSIGAGFVAQYADATLGNAVFTGGPDLQAKVTGTDWDFGYTLGVLWQPTKSTRIGAGYRSQINHSLDGDLRVTTPTNRVVRATGGRAALQTPQMLSVGIAQDIGDAWTVLATGEWTGWSTFDQLVVSFDDGGASSVTEEQWRDTYFLSLGTEYRPREDLTLQLGVAFDRTPNQDEFRTPRIPDANRTWLSFGVDWQPATWLQVGAAYSHIFVADGDIDLIDERPLTAGGRGTLTGTFQNSVDIFAVQGTLRF